MAITTVANVDGTDMTEREFLDLWKEDPRKADALVAEKVMGLGPPTHEAIWKYVDTPGDGYGQYCGWWCVECHGQEMPPMVRACEPGPATHHNYSVPPYTTTWDGMGKVVEKMRDEGWMFCLDDLGFDGEKWRARFDADREVNDKWGTGDDDVPFLAVAIAAGKALGWIE